MQRCDITICNKLGLHARASAKLTRLATTFPCEVWLTRAGLAELFGRDAKTIGKHVNNALKEELVEAENRVVAKFATTAADGKTYQTEHYSLDMILSVGYRVKSHRGVKFRRWRPTSCTATSSVA